MLRSGIAMLVVAGLATVASAQHTGYQAVRLDVSSFTQDGVVDYGQTLATAATSVTATMDGGTAKTGNTWYEKGFNAAAPTTGLPSAYFNPEFDATSSFYFENARTDATLKNILLLDSTAKTGTLTFGTPRIGPSLAFSTSSGNGTGTLTATVHFADGAADASIAAFKSPDWFNATDPRVVTSHGRVDVVGKSFNNVGADNPRVYAEIIDLPAANATDPIKSIDLSWTGSGATTHTFIFGVSATPEPASLGLAGLGALGLLFRRRI